MALGGFSTTGDECPLPLGAELIAPTSSAWRLGTTPVRTLTADGGARRVHLLGWCGATDAHMSALVNRPVPTDVAWRWPGNYAVVEENSDNVVLHTDPVSAFPLYCVPWRSGWAWSTSARLLAALAGSGPDAQRLACAVLTPSVPALAAGRSFFTNVEQVAPGCRTELPRIGTAPRRINLWRPDPEVSRLAHRHLRHTLAGSVTLRTEADPRLSSDLSGGLDSTSVAVLAADSLPAPHRLNAVTIHPEGNHGGADLRYARLTAASNGRIVHHLLPMNARHLPYTFITSVPPTDEPAPSTLTQARLRGQFRWMRDHLGTRTHLTGDGGDSVLFQPAAHLADLIRHRHLGRAASEAFGWARLRRTPVTSLLRDAVAMARTGRHAALTGLAGHLVGQNIGNRSGGHWFPLLPLPDWAEPAAVRCVVDAFREAATHPDPLAGLDASVRIAMDEIREVARTAVADAELAASCGVDLHNPFLDPTVVNAVLTNPLERRPAVHAYKPLLVRAVGDLLPPEVAARTTKGGFDADHYAGMRANLDDLAVLTDGHLVGLGLIEPRRLRSQLRRAAAGIPMSLATFEQALTAEAWLVAHHREPAPAWTTQPVRSAP
ncbi:albusnodin/ikarugamycin family macrolactam cyclase [Streptomyces atratus]|uniref:asparagine synthase (glutamine-hydrolyzing) n=1 Tax=Streptomyces atratus TaxID=1893 RepID=A0A1K1WNJ6_STRAR|nr:albusnodin/ikarugamycin family macrolactam cyclase [Streptomyces atratus]SFX38691.1 asparagine synthase (glutamine-hydrolysing) [Streptomyces atratus]